MTLRARSPSRIDLAGGTVDLWPLYLLIEEAATVNLAIDLYTEAEVSASTDGKWRVREKISGRERAASSPRELAKLEGAEIGGRLLTFFAPREPLSIVTHSDAPPQAGLGASSSLGVSIAGALNGLTGFRYNEQDLIDIVKDVEVEVLGAMTGAQDHYPPVYGGASCLWWEKVRHRREPLAVDAPAFENRFLLAYSHQPHRSGATNWEVVRRFLEGDEGTRRALEKSGRTAVALRNAFAAGDLDRVAALMGEDWDARRAMAPAVSSPELEAIIDAARGAGAVSAKVCGAGGGGCMVVAVPDGKRPAVEEAIRAAGGSVLTYHLVERGLSLVLDDPR
jgi:D-glycero-alpha-D-manno-heptose-7-phosphate kinase